MRPICGWWVNRIEAGKAAGTSSKPPPKPCDDNARRKRSLKRGGHGRKHDLEDLSPKCEDADTASDLIALDEALARLAEEDKLKADVVKLRYFAGLTVEQTAEALGISATTAKLHWAYARAWLLREIG
jgi:RNA polymerase sigma factor (TIGR02999 family)